MTEQKIIVTCFVIQKKMEEILPSVMIIHIHLMQIALCPRYCCLGWVVGLLHNVFLQR